VSFGVLGDISLNEIRSDFAIAIINCHFAPSFSEEKIELRALSVSLWRSLASRRSAMDCQVPWISISEFWGPDIC
jgi:hypothetical protein